MSFGVVIKYSHRRGEIEELVNRYAVFEQFKCAMHNNIWHKWIDVDTKAVSLQAMILFAGKTGYGKSTTVNAISGTNIFETSDVSACTKVCQCLDYRVHGKYWLSLGDLPGIGESEVRDEEYFKFYEDFIDFASVIVYVIRADMRDYSIDEVVVKQIYSKNTFRKRVIFALGQCDKIEPMSRKSCITPTDPQMKNIDNKVAEIIRVFSPHNRVIPYSAETGWNLHGLTSEIVRVALG